MRKKKKLQTATIKAYIYFVVIFWKSWGSRKYSIIAVLTSVIIICGVETTEQQIVAMALEIKSRPGPIFSLFRSNFGFDSTKELICARTASSTAKLNAPLL